MIMKQRHWTAYLLWFAAFAVAMAFLESAVVVYLRALYYPEGFRFPLAPIDGPIVLVEVLREVATLIMLLAPGALITRHWSQRFAWFCVAFGIWDLFYYIWLKVLLDWPGDLLEPDILFLVPMVWVGPVLAPCMVSVGLIALGAVLLHGAAVHGRFVPGRWHWAAMLAGAAVILYTFMEGPWRAVEVHGGDPWSPDLEALSQFVPDRYPWGLFLLGAGMAAAGIVHLAVRACRTGVAFR